MGKILSIAFLITLIIGGLAFVGYAHYCTAESDISTSITTSGGNGNLELTMTIDKQSYSLGEPINLTLTITNISNQTINFEHTGLDFDFQVFNDTNNLVYQWSNFKAIAQFIAIVPLPAGENMSTNFTWLQTCNFNASVQGDPISPGIYSIVGKTGPTYGIQTTPIQLTIGVTPAPSPTPIPTATPLQTPPATTLPATTNTGSTVDLTVSGNITTAQISNATIETVQSTPSTTVSFTVTGENGTIGFSNITVPMSAVLYGTTPSIFIDGQPAQDQGYTQDSNNYYVWYATHFSTHEVSIVFTAESSIPEFPLPASLFLFILMVVSVSVTLTPMNRKMYKKTEM